MKKVVKITSIVVVVLLVGVVIFRNLILEKTVLDMINTGMNEDEDRVYDISCEKVRIGVISGKLSLLNVSIIPREELKNKKGVYELPLVVDGKIEKLVIENFSWASFWEEEKLDIQQIIIHNPEVRLLIGDFEEKGTEEDEEGYTEVLAQFFKSIEIEQVAIENCAIDFVKMNQPQKTITTLESLSFVLNRIHVDSVRSKKDPFLFYENLEFDLKSIQSSLGDKYRFTAENLKVSAFDNILSLENLAIRPYSKMDTAVGVNRDYMKLDVSKVQLEGLDYKEVFSTGNISVNKIIANIPRFDYFLDFVHPVTANDKIAFLPSSMLKQIKTNIKVNSVEVINGSITLLFKNTVNEEAAPLTFQSLDASCNGFSVGKDWFKKDVVKLNATTLLQGEGEVKLQFVLPLNQANDEFYVKGSLGEMIISSLNPVIEGAAYVTIPKGEVNYIDFDFIADKYRSEGRLLADYSDLSLKLLKEPNEAKTKKKRYHHVTSFLANNMIKSNNNTKTLFYKEGYIAVQRASSTSFWGYLWQNLSDGILNSLLHTENSKKKKIKLYRERQENILMYQ